MIQELWSREARSFSQIHTARKGEKSLSGFLMPGGGLDDVACLIPDFLCWEARVILDMFHLLESTDNYS